MRHSGLEWTGCLSGSQDKREPKGQLTPGNSVMELRDPENHEDGDPEVRDGTQGRKKKRERDNAEINRVRDGDGVRQEADAEGRRERNKKDTGNQRYQRSRIT